MCMEDLKIGRNTQSAQIDVTLSTASQQILGPDPNRVAIIFGVPDSSRAYFSSNSPAVVGFGIPQDTAGHPFAITLAEHGEMVRKAWHVIALAGTPLISVFPSSYAFGEAIPNAPK